MLSPSSLGYRKYHKSPVKKSAEVKSLLPTNGGYGVKVLTKGKVTRLQLFALLKYLKRHIKKVDRFWITIFPHSMETKKGLGARMGKGKGALDDYIVLVKRGRVFLEFGGFYFSYSVLKSLFVACAHKLPLPVRFVKRFI